MIVLFKVLLCCFHCFAHWQRLEKYILNPLTNILASGAFDNYFANVSFAKPQRYADVSPFVSVKPLDICNEMSGYLPAVLVATERGTLSHNTTFSMSLKSHQVHVLQKCKLPIFILAIGSAVEEPVITKCLARGHIRAKADTRACPIRLQILWPLANLSTVCSSVQTEVMQQTTSPSSEHYKTAACSFSTWYASITWLLKAVS